MDMKGMIIPMNFMGRVDSKPFYIREDGERA